MEGRCVWVVEGVTTVIKGFSGVTDWVGSVLNENSIINWWRAPNH